MCACPDPISDWRDGEGIEQTEAGAANIQCATILRARAIGSEVGLRARIIVMRFAGGDDPIQRLRFAARHAQGFQRGGRGKRQLALAFGNVGERFDACAADAICPLAFQKHDRLLRERMMRDPVTAAEEMIETLAGVRR